MTTTKFSTETYRLSFILSFQVLEIELGIDTCNMAFTLWSYEVNINITNSLYRQPKYRRKSFINPACTCRFGI